MGPARRPGRSVPLTTPCGCGREAPRIHRPGHLGSRAVGPPARTKPPIHSRLDGHNGSGRTAVARGGGCHYSAAVPEIRCTHVEVYLFRRRSGRLEFLALRRSPGRNLGGVWQPVTGKIDRGESAFAAARREVLEETGLRPRAWWCLETMATFFDVASDSIRLLPLFAAEIGPRDIVRLSREHDAMRFASARTAARLYLWDTQRRGLEAVRREVLGAKPLSRALAVATPPRGSRGGRRKPAP